ncbi:MAG TPA: hypothetical protein DDW31_04785 [candidate division Zixibacteria bacterium]|jgi:hypothetical protein|nr:hypothetical protein [candidate division Zixibacteria bacterium]
MIMSPDKANKHLDTVLNLVGRMVDIAEHGVMDDSADNGFYLLYGLILDNARKIRIAAEKEYALRDLKMPDKFLAKTK